MSGKVLKIKIEKEKIRPRERAPILPSKKIEDKVTKERRLPKHKKDPLKEIPED